MADILAQREKKMADAQDNHEKTAARIAEMAETVFGVPRDELGLKTADDCARMLQILSDTPVESTDEPFLPPLDKPGAGEGAE